MARQCRSHFGAVDYRKADQCKWVSRKSDIPRYPRDSKKAREMAEVHVRLKLQKLSMLKIRRRQTSGVNSVCLHLKESVIMDNIY